MRLRVMGVLIVVLAVVAAACGGDDGGADADGNTTSTAPPDEGGGESSTSTSTTTTEAPVELTASWPGVTEDTIRLGFLEVDLETLVELELIDNNRGDPKVAIDALVAEVNERGGINGRKIELFFEKVLPIDTNDAEAACIRLTEDNEVFAVLGSFVGPTVGVDPCIPDLGETIMIGGAPTEADLERAKAPWLTTGMSSARALPAIIQLMSDEGHLDGTLGVVWAVEDESAALDIVLPELDRLGHDVAVTAAQIADAGDRRALATEWETLVEKLRTEGVDTVMLVLQSAGINGPNQLSLVGWEGEIAIVGPSVLTSIGITAQVPLEDLDGILGSMGATADEAYALPATQDCIDILEAAHPEITVVPSAEVPGGEEDWASALLVHCSRLRLFELIATAAGPDLTHDTFLAAAEGLGEIDLPGNPFTSLGPGKLDVSDSQRLATFDPTIGQFGGSAPAGDLIRVTG